MISNFFNFYWFFIGCFTEYDCNFDNTSKIGNSRPPWNKVSWNEFYCHNFCSWHHQQSFFTLLKLKCRYGHVRKFENQSILTREVIVTLFYKDVGRKTDCFEGWSWFKFDNMWLVLSMTLKFYSSVAKIKVKNKGQKVSRTNSYRGIQSKECYFMFTYTFLSFFIKKFVFSSF